MHDQVLAFTVIEAVYETLTGDLRPSGLWEDDAIKNDTLIRLIRHRAIITFVKSADCQ
jgi:hypothetical protein